MRELIQTSVTSLDNVVGTTAATIGATFLFNTFLHTATELRGKYEKEFGTLLGTLVKGNAWACRAMLDLINGNSRWLKEYFVECPQSSARQAAGAIIFETVRCYVRHHGEGAFAKDAAAVAADGVSASDGATEDPVRRLMSTLVQLLDKEAIEHHDHAADLFAVLCLYTKLGAAQRRHMLELDVPACLLRFLRGPSDPKGESRAWSRKEAREFGDVHRTLSELVCACDLSELTDAEGAAALAAAANPYAIDGGVDPLPGSLKEEVFESYRCDGPGGMACVGPSCPSDRHGISPLFGFSSLFAPPGCNVLILQLHPQARHRLRAGQPRRCPLAVLLQLEQLQLQRPRARPSQQRPSGTRGAQGHPPGPPRAAHAAGQPAGLAGAASAGQRRARGPVARH